MKATTIKPDRIFRALSDKTRLRILHLLLGGEVCVCDIVTTLKVPQPTASRHLAYLRKAGLVEVRKVGTWCHYRLAPMSTEFDTHLRKCIETCVESLPILKKDAQRLLVCRICCK